MSFLKGLFVSEKNVGKTLDMVKSAGDKLWYTDEEKADGMQNLRNWYIDLLGSMKPFNVAMRIITIGVGGAWLLHLLISSSLYAASAIWCVPVIVDSVAVIGACGLERGAIALDNQMDKHINDNFGLIVIFYFGAAGVNSAIMAAKGNGKKQ
jgi:hypothetical protein